MWVLSLGWEDPLEEDVETHSSILTWKIPWTEEPGRLWSTGSQRVGHDWSDLTHMHVCWMAHSLTSTVKASTAGHWVQGPSSPECRKPNGYR